jgi:hypothetical protein
MDVDFCISFTSSRLWDTKNAIGRAAGGPMKWRVLECWNGTNILPCIKQCEQLLTNTDDTVNTVWDIVPPQARTGALSLTACRLLTRGGGGLTSIHEIHSKYPFRGFSLLGPNLEVQYDEIKDDAPCTLGAFFHEHRAQYPGEELKSDDAMADLTISAELAEETIVRLEARNAQIRKLTTSSCQTWKKDVRETSASWVLQRGWNQLRGPYASKKSRKKILKKKNQKKSAKRCHSQHQQSARARYWQTWSRSHKEKHGVTYAKAKGGGPWKVHLGICLKGLRPFTAEWRRRKAGASVSYERIKALGGEEWQSLVNGGLKRTLEMMTGGGTSKNDNRRQVQRTKVAARVERINTLRAADDSARAAAGVDTSRRFEHLISCSEPRPTSEAAYAICAQQSCTDGTVMQPLKDQLQELGGQ